VVSQRHAGDMQFAAAFLHSTYNATLWLSDSHGNDTWDLLDGRDRARLGLDAEREPYMVAMEGTDLALHLYHGRTSPEQVMDGWGTDGPTYRVQRIVADRDGVTLVHMDGHAELLPYVDEAKDLLLVDGVYYGDWSACRDERSKDTP
jgi:hypothetical protein